MYPQCIAANIVDITTQLANSYLFLRPWFRYHLKLISNSARQNFSPCSHMTLVL